MAYVKNLKHKHFLTLIILSEKISAASSALTRNVSYPNLIFQVINSISQHCTISFGILRWSRLCLSIAISMSSISISIQFYTKAFKILISCGLSSILLISIMSLINEVWCWVITQILRQGKLWQLWKNKRKFQNQTIGQLKTNSFEQPVLFIQTFHLQWK